ncbi:hypothetical protein SNEBB_006976 [Seison nebaliae]|nr:hypothetical protein SNEBB_006976 [Seison nebaliae]
MNKLLKNRIINAINKSFLSTTTPQIAYESNADSLIPNLRVEVRSFDWSLLNSYEKFVRMTSKELAIDLNKITSNEMQIHRYHLLRSKFVHRKHFRQYEIRTHNKSFHFQNLTGSTSSVLLEYIQRNLPAGVAMIVHQTEMKELPNYIRNEAVK